MSQSIVLKRSALPGKVPDTGSLNLGEIAVNTYDGKVYLKRSGSVESIQSLVVTDTTTTGSISITQTGSFGELVIDNDANIQGGLYVTSDIVGNGDIDVIGNITGSNALFSGTATANAFVGDGSGLTNLNVSIVFNAQTALINEIDGNVLLDNSIADFFLQFAVNGLIDFDFNY